MPRLDRPFTSTQTSTQTPPPLLAVLGLGVVAACAGAPEEALLDDTGGGALEAAGAEAEAEGGRSRTGAPEGTLRIEPDGAWVNTQRVTVHVTQTAGAAAKELCVGTTPTCSRWQPITDRVEVTLGRTAGLQFVRGWLRTASGQTSELMRAGVRLDLLPPVIGEVVAVPTAGGADLRWSGFTDAPSGLAAYRVVGQAGEIVPRCQNAEAFLYEGTATSFSVTGFSALERLSLRVCARDLAGNWSQGRPLRVQPTGDPDAPVVRRFVINADAAFVRDREITLSSVVDDASGVTQVCLSESATAAEGCSPWRDYAPEMSFELSGGAGPKTLRAWFRDPHGNTSAVAADSTTFDRIDPENGAVQAEVQQNSVQLGWSGFEDALAGVVSYVVVRGEDVAPDDCASGVEVGRGMMNQLLVPDLPPMRYGFRVCAIDAAGNVSSGEPVRATVRGAVVPPSITRLRGAGGAETFCDADAALELRATGDAEITRMCITESPEGCAYWAPFSETPTARLSSGEGQKTLYAWVRDAEGVASEEPRVLEVERIACASELVLSSPTLDLGPICGAETAELRLSNAGNIPMTVSSLSVSGTAFSIAPAGLPWVIAPGETRSLPVSATPGTGTLSIETDAPGARLVRVPLAATLDLPPEISWSGLSEGEIVRAGGTARLNLDVSDPEQDPRELEITVESSVDGVIFEGAPDGLGLATATWSGASQTAGDHTLRAVVTDQCGQTDTVELGMCQDAGFTAENLDLTTWNLNGSARWDAANRWIELTAARNSQGGTAFQTVNTVDAGDIDISFSFYMSGGTGADGISVTALDFSRMTSFVGIYGGGLGYMTLPGWSVEVDNWFNGWDPTIEDHISVHIDGDVRQPILWRALPDMEDGRWHTMRVRANGDMLTVTIDGTVYIDQIVPELSAFPAYVGFTAATGGATQNHLIDSLEVRGTACD